MLPSAFNKSLLCSVHKTNSCFDGAEGAEWGEKKKIEEQCPYSLFGGCQHSARRGYGPWKRCKTAGSAIVLSLARLLF